MKSALPLSFPRSLIEQLDHLARLQHTSRSAIVLRATRALIKALSQQQQKER
ncbi:MAG: ribbon-helix-helix protein, CopG family [Akkermansia sp.]|nr:ribbon-helix-helix protein, CopG family [Akkermansia sp.]